MAVHVKLISLNFRKKMYTKHKKKNKKIKNRDNMSRHKPDTNDTII